MKNNTTNSNFKNGKVCEVLSSILNTLSGVVNECTTSRLNDWAEDEKYSKDGVSKWSMYTKQENSPCQSGTLTLMEEKV